MGSRQNETSFENCITVYRGHLSPIYCLIRRRHVVPYVLILPAALVATCVTHIPLVYDFWLSLHDWYLLSNPVPKFAGFLNYHSLFYDRSLLSAFWRTWIWTLGTVAIELGLGLPIALLLNRRGKINEFLSAIILLPWVTPFIVVSYGWRFLLNSEVGLLHHILQLVGIAGERSILSDPNLALFTVIAISGWKGTPFMVIALLATLKGISENVYEAARIDGAGPWQIFRFIILPLIRNTALIISIVLGILAFYSFDLAWLMTTGGPGEATTLAGIKIFQTFFVELRPAYAATIAVAMLPWIAISSILMLRLRRPL